MKKLLLFALLMGGIMGSAQAIGNRPPGFAAMPNQFTRGTGTTVHNVTVHVPVTFPIAVQHHCSGGSCVLNHTVLPSQGGSTLTAASGSQMVAQRTAASGAQMIAQRRS